MKYVCFTSKITEIYIFVTLQCRQDFNSSLQDLSRTHLRRLNFSNNDVINVGAMWKEELALLVKLTFKSRIGMRGEQWACNRPGLQSVAALPSCSSGSHLGCHVDLNCLDDRECLHRESWWKGSSSRFFFGGNIFSLHVLKTNPACYYCPRKVTVIRHFGFV